MLKLNYQGKKLQLEIAAKKFDIGEVKQILEILSKAEEAEFKENAVNQFKADILQDAETDLAMADWWELPSDLLQGKESGPYISMESDLNPQTHYEKTSFSLSVVVTEAGRQVIIDREGLRKALQKVQISDKLRRTNSILVRVKGLLSKDSRAEVEDFLRKHLNVERSKVIFEKKNYGERASLELVLFGEFAAE